jgi:hypothetical protein
MASPFDSLVNLARAFWPHLGELALETPLLA